ncbi:MAG: hypothetical protein A2798_00925 [Candidatus Levybacteria bacterium RIFCSPHIGHO2_01_FULL_37_17]|nr:MAG: hypothetical protein A2798_00925 [Candidatus Levybacteria bacterium RIFCSPHIGHO2_01_FULL_37_17]OGH37014.1 MAG: hypothetical protein A2959_01785 [Candidatus Levybacteria bacterium RIFCSPLOWO2_01_FULL_38_23]
MTNFFDRIFRTYPVKTHRALEMMPGTLAWFLILFPVWGSFFIPLVVAYFILFFDVYWFYKSFTLAATAFIASRKIKEAEKKDWLFIAKPLENFEKMSHIVIIPNYTESADKIKPGIESLFNQTFPTERLHVVLAMEKRESGAKIKAKSLIAEFEGKFGSISATFHPDIVGEVKGKSSNESYAAKIAYKKLVTDKVVDENFTTISSVDADSIFDRQYFSYLSFEFLRDSERHNKFYQSANVYYNNFWKVPAPTRIITFFGSLWRMALLVQKDRLISNSTYSLSLKLLREIGFWDTDVIPEDYRIFFKAFYKKQGKVSVQPIFLKTSMDAPLSSSYIGSLKNKYHQERRWSWGASDDPLFIKWWLTVPNVPFFKKTVMLINVLVDHTLWPVNWFIITIAANVMPFINPVFTRTALGYNLPKIAGFILTLTVITTAVMFIIDYRTREKHHRASKKRLVFFPFEFLLLPFVGFFLSALPALISHTQLMLGKRLEYKVTEKI